jgi:hypothetical protein
MIQCENTPFAAEDSVLRRLKETAAFNRRPDWNSVSEVVTRIAGIWTFEYDAIIVAERGRCFEFPNAEERNAHRERIEQLLAYGCDLLLVIHAVEDESNPPVELTSIEKKLVYALRVLKIAQSAYSISTESMSARIAGIGA